ncbi:phosphomannomutase/phosphoglucomutase [Patescibacteria group bacterium]|nr:phosphomannomutase/phosphoglucomutase [Patescibacteria group bacterium]
MISPNIFKAYDIRGIYPAEINEETAYAIGQALVADTNAKTVALGQDIRLSSKSLAKALSLGILDSGADIYDLGQIPTEMIYYSVGKKGYDAGIMVTASHNPKEYNGFKMIKKSSNGFEMISGKSLALGEVASTKKGRKKKIDLKKEYAQHCLSLFPKKDLRVVVDASNGMASKIIPFLGIKTIPLNFKLDGRFPGHSPNPLEEGSTQQISKAVLEKKADFGVIFDGDADRIFLITEKGELVRGDATLLLLAKYFLDNKLGDSFAYNLICSRAVPELIGQWGGRAVRTPVGYLNVKEGLVKNSGALGGEISGHYCFRDNFYGDSGVMAFLVLLNVLSGKKASELAKEMTPYAKGAEINFTVKDKEAVMQKVKEKYADGKIDYLDGITIQYEKWWFNLRPSNTEPLLRLTIEAEESNLLEEQKAKLVSFILSFCNSK